LIDEIKRIDEIDEIEAGILETKSGEARLTDTVLTQ